MSDDTTDERKGIGMTSCLRHEGGYCSVCDHCYEDHLASGRAERDAELQRAMAVVEQAIRCFEPSETKSLQEALLLRAALRENGFITPTGERK